MPIFIDLKDKIFGRLIVKEIYLKDHRGSAFWVCSCFCGESCIVKGDKLRSGNTKSCGCLRIDTLRKRSITHGLKKHKLYSNWNGMMYRCYSNKAPNFHRYGGRGIKVCSRWHMVQNFIKDLEKMYFKHVEKYGIVDTTIDRIDVNGDYEPRNVRFATRKEQSNNRQNHYVKHNK